MTCHPRCCPDGVHLARFHKTSRDFNRIFFHLQQLCLKPNERRRTIETYLLISPSCTDSVWLVAVADITAAVALETAVFVVDTVCVVDVAYAVVVVDSGDVTDVSVVSSGIL